MQEKISIKENIIKYDRKTLIKDIEEVINARFENGEFQIESSIDDLHDPYLLTDMDKAVARIKLAKENDERVFIFGDYDVDGVTSTSILMHFFKKIGMKISYRLPHRVKDGYGLKKYFVDEAKELGVSLIITVDCGTRDADVIKHGKELGVDIIVTDHHAVPDNTSNEAVAMINPKRPDCEYVYKNLAGAGVAFKLMQALAYEYFSKEKAREYIIESVDIAAIGTVADCMRLTGENRIIVQEGLKQIKKSRSNGIRKLIQDKMHEDLDADLFGFTIGPRLNAAGRMDSPYKAVNLILNNGDTLNKTIAEIESLNEQRKFLTKEYVNDAMNKIDRNANLIFYVSPAITHGIIGIVAGRITEQLYRPCICMKDEGDKLVASCRSPEFFSIIKLLDKFSEYFIGYGGHKQAAGFSITKEKFPEFRSKIMAEINKENFSHHKKEILVDKVIRFEELGFHFLNKVNKYKPFGIGNTKPVFMVENMDYEKMEFLGKGRDHLRFTTKHGFKIFAFYMGDFYEKLKIGEREGKKIDLIFDVSEDSWMGKKNLMLKVVDIILN